MRILSDSEFYCCTYQQAQLIRENDFARFDIESLLGEAWVVGKNRYRAIESALEQLLLHLLKWQMQSQKEDRHDMEEWYLSWVVSINKQREAVRYTLKKKPGLKNKRHQLLTDAYEGACKLAADAMKCKITYFSTECPWTYEQIMTEDWLPQ